MNAWKTIIFAIGCVGAIGTLVLLNFEATDGHDTVSSPQPVRYVNDERQQQPVDEPPLSKEDIETLKMLPCFATDASVDELIEWMKRERDVDALKRQLRQSAENESKNISQVAGTTSGQLWPPSHRQKSYRIAQYPDNLIDLNGLPLSPDDTLLLPPSNGQPPANQPSPNANVPRPERIPPVTQQAPPIAPGDDLLLRQQSQQPQPAVPSITPPTASPQQSPVVDLPTRNSEFVPPAETNGGGPYPYRTDDDRLVFPNNGTLPPNQPKPINAPQIQPRLPNGNVVPNPPTNQPVPQLPRNTLPPPTSQDDTPSPGLPEAVPLPNAPQAPYQPQPGQLQRDSRVNVLQGQSSQNVAPPRTPASSAPVTTKEGQDPHAELFKCDPYPSASQCKKCHEKIYEEWSVSSHAYASISPMFHKFEQRINELASGTVGHFCMRCHAPVATALGLPRDTNIFDSIPAAREGVTCVACHRVRQRYQKVNGERRIEPGDIFEPVYGTSDGSGLAQVRANKDTYKVKTEPGEKGQGLPIHSHAIQFDQLKSSHFCVSCHQVAVYPGIKLEVVWEQYRDSPARRQGITCQDCHMGKTPGRAEGYEKGPSAIVGTKQINKDRQHSNHMFFGPGYSIAHPGTFPHNQKADHWRYDQWLEFNWRAGWGTERFENLVEDGKLKVNFPPTWSNVDDRYDAREVIDDNLELLAKKKHARKVLMENGSKLEGPFFVKKRRVGKMLKFNYLVTNMNSGHNMPSGSLGAQPQIWLNVVLTDPDGCRVWESGYTDSNGDLADLHSLDVAAGRIKHDNQLFNLQTKFLTTNVKGTDREMYLPINVDVDQLPFIRPSGFPITTMNHPPLIRMEGHSLPPLGHRRAHYHVPGKLVAKPGTWRLSVRMRSRAEPIYFMKFVRATPAMEQAMNERMLDFHEYSVEFEVE